MPDKIKVSTLYCQIVFLSLSELFTNTLIIIIVITRFCPSGRRRSKQAANHSAANTTT